MGALFTLLQVVVGVGSLICFIMVLIKMFQRGQTGLGIVCIVLVPCCGIGALVAFIVGWIKATEWGIQQLMIYWTVLWVAGLILGALGSAMGLGPQFQPADFNQM